MTSFTNSKRARRAKLYTVVSGIPPPKVPIADELKEVGCMAALHYYDDGQECLSDAIVTAFIYAHSRNPLRESISRLSTILQEP